MTFLHATICFALSNGPPLTKWDAVDRIYSDVNLPIIAEYVADKSISIEKPKETELASKLNVYGNVLDSNALFDGKRCVFQSKFIESDLRMLGNLRLWSARKETKISGVSRVGIEAWSIKLPNKTAISLTELKKIGAVTFDNATPWLTCPRFIIRADSISLEELLTSILECLGGRITYVSGQKILAVDPISFRKRRIGLASEQMRRFGPPYKRPSIHEFDFARAQIEVEVLRKMKDSDVSAVFNTPTNAMEVEAKEGSALEKYVLQKLEIAHRSIIPRPVISEKVSYFGRLDGQGNAGGIFVQSNGHRTIF